MRCDPSVSLEAGTPIYRVREENGTTETEADQPLFLVLVVVAITIT